MGNTYNSEEVPEDDYKYTLDYKLTDKTWSFAPAEISIPSVKLKAGDKIKIQDAKENCWIWVDYIYLMEEENVCSKLPFADVEKGDWYYEYVAAVYERALMTGLDKDIFWTGGESVKSTIGRNSLSYGRHSGSCLYEKIPGCFG